MNKLVINRFQITAVNILLCVFIQYLINNGRHFLLELTNTAIKEPMLFLDELPRIRRFFWNPSQDA